MSCTINASTTAGLISTADLSGSLQLQTNSGTTAVTITSGQNIGIGTASPVEKLEINSGALAFSGTATFNGSGDGIYHFGGNGLGFVTGGSNRAIIDSSGNLLVGGTGATPVQSNTAGAFAYRPTAQLEINGNATQAAFFGRTNDGSVVGFWSGGTQRGSISISGATTSYNTSSDYRLKENIAPMTGALDTISQLNPVTYKWKFNGADGQGFIAHELQEIMPDCVVGEKDAIDVDGNPVYQGIDTSFLVATLTAAIQELKAINDTQAETINALTARVAALEAK